MKYLTNAFNLGKKIGDLVLTFIGGTILSFGSYSLLRLAAKTLVPNVVKNAFLLSFPPFAVASMSAAVVGLLNFHLFKAAASFLASLSEEQVVDDSTRNLKRDSETINDIGTFVNYVAAPAFLVGVASMVSPVYITSRARAAAVVSAGSRASEAITFAYKKAQLKVSSYADSYPDGYLAKAIGRSQPLVAPAP